MPKTWSLLAVHLLAFGLVGGLAPARADVSGCQKQANCNSSSAVHRSSRYTGELAAQGRQRPQITVHPRPSYAGPNAKRHCRFWLAQEYRISGTVIVPQQQCWWQ
jgi:hypothetical protein